MDRPALEAIASEWLVYGDSLQESGDPRGQLVALSHGVDQQTTEDKVRDAYVREHGAALLGEAKQYIDSYVLEWRFCELVAAEVHVKHTDNAVELVRALLAAPTASQLSQLTLCGHGDKGYPIDLSAAVALLASEDRIRGLVLVDERAAQANMLVSRDFEPDQNLVQFGPLGALWPKLERLKLVVADAHQLDLGTIDAPELRNFVLHDLRYGDGWGGDAAPISSALAEANWPKLAELELRLCETWMANIPLEDNPYISVYEEDDERYDEADEGDCDSVNWEELAGLLANVAKCPLRRLALTSFVGSQSLINTLGQAGLPPTLVELDLSHSELGDDAIDTLFEHQAAFAHVKRFVLDGTHVTAAGLERLRGMGAEVVKDESPAGAKYRYVVGQE